MDVSPEFPLYIQLLLALAGIVVTAVIPVLTKFLSDWLKSVTNERTMIVLSELVQVAVEAVEHKYPTGEEKKAAVIAAVTSAATALGLKISVEALDALIDILLEASVMRTFNQQLPMLPEGFE